MANIKISSKWARKKFPCYPEYIINNCRGRCCEGTGKILVSLLPGEEKYHRDFLGCKVKEGKLLAHSDSKKCVHKNSNSLCNLHNTAYKPFGCVASPFTLNKNNTLIVRYRYTRLKCHGQGEPAYITFFASLVLLFGQREAARIKMYLDAGGGDMVAIMHDETARKIKYLDGLKKDG